MTSPHVVTITRDGNQLLVDPLQIELDLGDSVQWEFEDPDLDGLGYINFLSPEHPFGPFQFVVPTTALVHGFGNTGIAGEYPYIALILDADGVKATSASVEAKIVNNSTTVATSEATIRHDETFHIDPPTLRVQRGQTALWYIPGLTNGQFVTFLFDGFEDELVGPFSTFAITRGFDNAQIAIGVDFKGPLSGHDSVHYQVALREQDGTVSALSPDPVIEPVGSPPEG